MELTDAQWAVVEPLIPKPKRRPDGKGRPPCDPRDALEGILWILRTGAPWPGLPERFPSYQACHRWFQRWERDGTILPALKALAQDLEERGGIDLSERFVDAAFASAKRGGAGVGPTKRGKGSKVMAVADRSGLPVAVWALKRFSRRGRARRRHPRRQIHRRPPRAADRRHGLRLGRARPVAEGAVRHRDDRAAQPEQEDQDPGRTAAQALQEEVEGGAPLRLLQADRRQVGEEAGELHGVRAPRLRPDPAQAVLRQEQVQALVSKKASKDAVGISVGD